MPPENPKEEKQEQALAPEQTHRGASSYFQLTRGGVESLGHNPRRRVRRQD